MTAAPPAPDLSNDPPRSLSLVAQTVLCALAVVCLLYIPIPILPFLAQYYALEPGQAGLALSAFSAACLWGRWMACRSASKTPLLLRACAGTTAAASTAKA